MWFQRKPIDNSTFKNEFGIGTGLSIGYNYNTSHCNITRNSLHNQLMCLFT